MRILRILHYCEDEKRFGSKIEETRVPSIQVTNSKSHDSQTPRGSLPRNSSRAPYQTLGSIGFQAKEALSAIVVNDFD